MEVDDAVEGLVGSGGLLLCRDPVPHGPEVVPEVDLAGGLDAREHAWHGGVRLQGERRWPRMSFRGGRRPVRSTPMSYAVRTPVFEGPFDLLLHLILKQEVELWEVSLAEIVDAYLAELDRIDSFDLDVATEFLLIAATLVELKARRLLPGIEDLELDEELLRFEERDLLLARLLECKTFKDAARALEGRMRRADRSVPRTAGPEEPYRWMVPDPLERVRLDALRAAALRMLAAPPDRRRRHRPRRAGAGQRARRGGVGPPAPARVRAHELPGAGVGRRRTGSR